MSLSPVGRRRWLAGWHTPGAQGVSIRRSGRALVPLLAFLALTALFYAPVLLGRRWFPAGDFTDHFLPFSMFQRSEWLAGRLPVWNPYTFSGHPFLADVQAAVFYPISNLVLALTLPWSGIMARLYWLQVEALLHVALGGYFVYLLAADLIAYRRAAFLAGCVFAFSGYLTGYPALQTAVLRTAIWLPLVLWCLGRAFRDLRGRRWWAAAAVAYTIAFLAGHPQTFLHLTYCTLGWLVLQALTTRLPRRAWLPGVAAFFALFLGLSAAQLWPSLEFTALSVRAQVDYAFVSGGFRVPETLQMLVPGVMTRFSPLYVGLVALGLALLACGKALTRGERLAAGEGVVGEPEQRRTRGGVLFFALVAVLALLARYGGNGPLYPLLYRWAPGWSYFRGQERAAYLVAFSLSVLAGYGAAAWTRLSPRIRGIAALVWGVTAAGLLWAAAPVLSASPELQAHAALVRGAIVSLAVLAAVAAAGVFSRRAAPRTPLLTLLILIELFAGNMAVNWSDRPTLPSPEALAVASAGTLPDASAALARTQNDGRLPEDYGMLVGVEDVWGSSPLRLARYDTLVNALPPERLWQLTGVGVVLNWYPSLNIPAETVAKFATDVGVGYVHRLARGFPRAWVVNELRTADDLAAATLLADPALDLARTAVLPPAERVSRPQGLEDGLLAPAGPAEVYVERRGGADLRLRVKTAAGGYLVVSENWLPGWHAVVSSGGKSQPADVLRTDLAFLGLAVPPGESTVELRYRPLSVRGGLLISLATVLLLAGALLVPGVGPRVAPRPRSELNSRAGRRGALLLALAAVIVVGAAAFVWSEYARPSNSRPASQQVAALMERYAGGWPQERVRTVRLAEEPRPGAGDPGAAEVLPAAEAQAREAVAQWVQQGVERVVLAVPDGPAAGQRALADAYALHLEAAAAGWRVQVYDRAPAALEPVNVAFANGVRLGAIGVSPVRATPGDVLPVYLQWEATAPALSGSEMLTLQLLDSGGQLAAQLDQTFGAADLAGRPAHYELMLSRLLQPGAYRLIAALYDTAKAGTPRVLTTDGADHVLLKAFVGP